MNEETPRPVGSEETWRWKAYAESLERRVDELIEAVDKAHRGNGIAYDNGVKVGELRARDGK